MLTFQLQNEQNTVAEFEDKNMLWPITNCTHVGQNMFCHLLVDGHMLCNLNSSKLPATAVVFMEIIVVSKRKKS
jgi:hypothetical protein